LLTTINHQWNKLKAKVKIFSTALAYVDRYLCQHLKLPCLRNIFLNSFRLLVIGPIKEDINDRIGFMINLYRAGQLKEPNNLKPVSDVLSMYKELELGHTYTIYRDYFESQFTSNSRQYFKDQQAKGVKSEELKDAESRLYEVLKVPEDTTKALIGSI